MRSVLALGAWSRTTRAIWAAGLASTGVGVFFAQMGQWTRRIGALDRSTTIVSSLVACMHMVSGNLHLTGNRLDWRYLYVSDHSEHKSNPVSCTRTELKMVWPVVYSLTWCIYVTASCMLSSVWYDGKVMLHIMLQRLVALRYRKARQDDNKVMI